MESDFSKATQLGPRVAIVPLEPTGVKGWGSPEMPISPGDPAGKSGKGPYLHFIVQFVLWGSVLPDQRQGLPQREGLIHGVGGDNGENTPQTEL